MRRFSLRARVGAVLLLASLAPLVILFITYYGVGEGAALARPEAVRMLLFLTGGVTVILAAVLSVLLVGLIERDVDQIARLTDRARGRKASSGEGAPAAELAQLSTAHQRLATSLEIQERRLRELASGVSAATITDPATEVASRVVQAARDVTRDPTWSLAVLVSPDPTLLPEGVYDPSARTGPVEELHRWGSTARGPDDDSQDGGSTLPAVQLEGPWGGFVVVPLFSADGLRAILYAPWEGRRQPTGADLSLFSLLGQHAATALDHALLYARRNEQAATLDRMAGVQRDFLRAVTHDLQTPLTSIRMLATELAQHPQLQGEARESLALIEQQAERLRRMVSQLLVVSRLEAGVLVPRQDPFRVEPIVERAWEALHVTEHPFRTSSTGAPHLVVGDQDRFEQIVWAVLDNAVKYSEPGTRVSVAFSTVPSEDGGLAAEVAVTDRGSGMDEATSAHAFEQFYRGPAATERVPDGSGIGLYAARGLARAMGGDILLESVPDQGTTVRIRLPAEPAAQQGAE